MNASYILDFYARLKNNNNRIWFDAHKAEYQKVKTQVELITENILKQLTVFDKTLINTTAKECIFRIYRDIRFSYDKTPYKNHLGIFMARNGGRKSAFAGYYLHIEPGKNALIPGVYCPDSNILKSLRWSIVDNLEEWNEIVENEDFKKYYLKQFSEDKLKKVPSGFPKDFSQPELLKYKHYAFECPLADSFFEEENWEIQVATIFEKAYPFIRFLNYTIEENLNIVEK